MRTHFLTLRKGTFDFAYSVAREAVERGLPAGLTMHSLDQIIEISLRALLRHNGFRGIWDGLAREQQEQLFEAIYMALFTRQLCDPLESAKVDRHIRLRQHKMAKRARRMRQGEVADTYRESFPALS